MNSINTMHHARHQYQYNFTMASLRLISVKMAGSIASFTAPNFSPLHFNICHCIEERLERKGLVPKETRRRNPAGS